MLILLVCHVIVIIKKNGDRLVKRVTIYFCEESNKCFAANPSNVPMTPVAAASVAIPEMKPYRTTATTAAAIMFDTLALENIGVLVSATINQL